MPDLQGQSNSGSEYNQQSFIGGMNLLLDDTHLSSTQYKIGFNVRNRYDRLDLVLSSVEDINAPAGLKQEMVTFGNFEILFVAGKAYYKYFTDMFWTVIGTFAMSDVAPRYWTVQVPLATTNYLRLATTVTIDSQEFASQSGPINVNQIAGASGGNLPGLLVQDNINQPMFIFINGDGIPEARTTQRFDQWLITFTDATNVAIDVNGDKREYVPIGNAMAWIDGVLYIASPDYNLIFRSVSGRPLDFVVNVTNLLADGSTLPAYTQYGGGDAYTTAYSVGVGGISCLRALSDDSLFVAASNANFSVSKNLSNVAPKEFGEYTFIRKFLFNAVCLSDRAIFDSIGDTRFISLTGVRSFNAVEQTQNEGRNSSFTANIRSAFGPVDSPIIQDASNSAAILFDDYELYAVNTVFGPAIAVYDTINACWSAFDINQTKGKKIKIFAKIELTVQALYAVTEDDKVYKLYAGPDKDQSTLRTVSVCSNVLYADTNIKMANPRMEIQPRMVRGILNNITESAQCTCLLYVNNRMSVGGTMTKTILYVAPPIPSNNVTDLDDVDTLLENMLFSTPNAEQGWKVFAVFSWTNGSLTQFSMELNDLTPMQPLNSQ